MLAQGETQLHEEGRCAIRRHCGKKSIFGGDLPCPDNGLAEEPDRNVRQKLVGLCGEKWNQGPVCCVEGQVDALSRSLKLAEGIIASCPACRENFFNIFCTFTCSPNQSLFVNVTQTEKGGSGKEMVTELENLWSEEYQSGFYDSCKNVKNGASGGKAIDFIGGGAQNYTKFMKFLGDKKLLGSPFQINFLTEPNGLDAQGMRALSAKPKACHDPDPAFRCSCIDCPDVCPELPAVAEPEQCHVGLLPCLSLAVILIYSVFLLLLILASSYRAYRERRFRKPERVRLLQDPSPSDDEDEGDLVRNGGYLEPSYRAYRLNSICDRAFSRLGAVCARFPGLTIGTSFMLVVVLSFGWFRFAVETDPVRLWVSPSSEVAQEKEYFDSNFGPFYRAEQAFLVNDTGPVMSYETLSWWCDVESRVRRMISLNRGLSLDDVCFKPTGNACVVESLTGYFGGSFSSVPIDWRERVSHCAASPGDVKCLPDFQQPLKPTMILGGYEATGNVLDARALISTWVVNNYAQGTEGEARAMDWEDSLRRVLEVVQEEANERGLRVSFTTESSIEQELNKSSNTDARIVLISYAIMFIYAALALGSATVTWKAVLTNPANILVQSKFTLAVVGILIVIMSVSASVGAFSAVGIKATLIIAEVIPFLVLAVGVDNIFLIVHEFERVNISHQDEEIDERVARTVGRMGPSILLSAVTETMAFSMGAFVGMPAVKNFAAYAAGAVFINAVLQVTMFISVLALNQRRVESLRADCLPCLTVRKATSSGLPDSHMYEDVAEEGVVQQFIRRFYAPALLGRKVKVAVVILFLGLFTAGLSLMPEVNLGLDQRIALPSDSYLIQYFNDLGAYFETGPPVYFVTRDVNVTERIHQRQLCGRFTTCEEFSLAFVLEQESKRPNVSYLSGSTASWIDDFFYWLNPQQNCCKENGNICFEDREPPWNITLYGMPEGLEFIHYLKRWITASTDASCPLGGRAAYSNALLIDSSRLMTNASHFRTSHTPMKSQEDFINSYTAARRIASGISKDHQIDVFPYSKFYIFFDQYVSIIQLTGTLLGAAIAIVFVITSILLGSTATGALVTTTVIMIVVDVIGAMAVTGVSLNAVSLVNLVICVGIGVEFCAHMARAFMFPSRVIMDSAPTKFRGKDARAWTAMVNVGSSVFTGITITKFLGVCVLAFTRSKIFEIYYFRVWLALVVFASTHALILLPVVLSYFGGEGYADPESDGGLEENLASRGYRSLLIDQEYDSDDD